jgi:hypothetical protein
MSPRRPQEQVVVKEDDATMTAAEIRANLDFALGRAIDDLAIPENLRKRMLVVRRCLLTEKAPSEEQAP